MKHQEDNVYTTDGFDTVNLAGVLADYEAGALNTEEVLDLFSFLVTSGVINHLQGSYQRTAQRLIEAGEI